MAATGPTVRLEPDGDLAWVVLDRPEVLNAMSGQVRDELGNVLAQVAGGTWQSMILRGEGRAFSSGADLGAYLDEVDVTRPQHVRAYMEAWNEVIRAIRDLPIPSVAAVHRHTYGGGLNLALACDVVVAARSAKLCESYVNIGVNADLGGSWMLPRLVGLAQARRLLLTGAVIDADEAHAIGLVADVVDDDELFDAARATATVIASKDPTAVAETRRLVDASLDRDLGEALDAEADAIARVVSGEAFQAAVAKFRASLRRRTAEAGGDS